MPREVIVEGKTEDSAETSLGWVGGKIRDPEEYPLRVCQKACWAGSLLQSQFEDR